MTINTVIIRQLKTQDYLACWQAMKAFTDQRTEDTQDEIWLLEHFPGVYPRTKWQT